MVETRGNGDPEVIGPYQVLARLGRGGFGTVYACTHARTGEHAAVKVVHPHLSDAPEFRVRFRREVAAISRVGSEYAPRVLDDKTSGEPAWLATELIPGPSLARVVDSSGPLPEPAVWRLGMAMAEALAAIHQAGVVHRDLKPQNVLLVPDRPWIIDFGLVHLSDLPHQSSSRLAIATYQYAAPEQLRHGLRGAGIPADIFAFGATLLFAATGHPPHEADSEEQLFLRVIRGKPNLDRLPSGLRDLVESCLQRVPEGRQALGELRKELAGRALPGAGRESAGRAEFAAFLPGGVVAMLSDFQYELGTVLGGRGLARLGWRSSRLPGADVPSPVPGFRPAVTDRVQPWSDTGASPRPRPGPADTAADEPGAHGLR